MQAESAMAHHDSNLPLVVAQALRASYEAADYEVVQPGAPALLRIGAPTPRVALDEARTWRRLAIVTAWNPFSVPLPVEANVARQRLLQRAVERAGRSQLPALGRDPAGEWAPEPSLAVFDATDDDLDDWMLAFGQNAVVVATVEGTCGLRLHPHERTRCEAEGPVAERAAARLWVCAWTSRDPDLLQGALREDVVLASRPDGTSSVGRAAVCERLCGALQSQRPRLSASVAPSAEPRSRRPFAVLSAGDSTKPVVSVLFTLREGSIARVDVCSHTSL